ncbi:MAG: NAD(P)H-binding protein, partial [Chloroflexi bacterium]|nr:NAD(P)H-binding protein [Chloroflexota bacterium]
MKAFVTGGTGFIGQRVIQKLLARGYQVYALARSANSAQVLADQGCTVVHGDITDTESMREGMTGSDVVFHMAAWYDYDAKASL